MTPPELDARTLLPPRPRRLPTVPKPPRDPVVAALEGQTKTIGQLVEVQAAALLEWQDRKRLDQRIAALEEECRAHHEAAFERQVLEPLALGLIGLADRARRECTQLRRALKRRGRPARPAPLLEDYLAMRTADVAELEALLQTLGVESFQQPDDRFDSSAQTCRIRVNGPPERAGCIAGRLLPGYRRGARVLRREQVKVYVPPTPTPSTGDAS